MRGQNAFTILETAVTVALMTMLGVIVLAIVLTFYKIITPMDYKDQISADLDKVLRKLENDIRIHSVAVTKVFYLRSSDALNVLGYNPDNLDPDSDIICIETRGWDSTNSNLTNPAYLAIPPIGSETLEPLHIRTCWFVRKVMQDLYNASQFTVVKVERVLHHKVFTFHNCKGTLHDMGTDNACEIELISLTFTSPQLKRVMSLKVVSFEELSPFKVYGAELSGTPQQTSAPTHIAIRFRLGVDIYQLPLDSEAARYLNAVLRKPVNRLPREAGTYFLRERTALIKLTN